MNGDRPTFYVTTPIYYANAKPHLGSLYTTVLADVAARINKISGKETFLLTGTDEHGQKIAQAAAAKGLSPQELVDQMVPEFKKVWDLYGIDYTRFIRTTDDYHVKGVQTWITMLMEKGDIYKGTYTGWYCIPCETFITEKERAEHDAKAPICPTCGRDTVQISEESYFFRLSAYQDKLLAFYKDNPDFVTPSERVHEVINFVNSGLTDLSISRSTVTWGIPFPGDEKHKVYVWADALNNYITALGYPEDKEKEMRFWPADLQVMGKDIVRFHAIYWPAFLMASGLELPRRLLVHGWIKVGEAKMSKSLGNAVDPIDLARIYGPESIRYYLVRHMSIMQDSPFNTDDLEKRLNADLANDLGNLLNRMVTLATKHGIATVTAPTNLTGPELELRDKLWTMINDFNVDMEDYFCHRAYGHVWKFINTVNAYFHSQEPWKIASRDPERFKAIISAVAHSLNALGILIWPLMPRKMEELLASLGVTLELGSDFISHLSVEPWNKTFTLALAAPLFERYEAPVVKVPEATQESAPIVPQIAEITMDQFAAVKLCVGTIVTCDEVPKSDRLYKLSVDFGEHGIRQICSGVRQHFTKEQLIGKQGVFVLNLQPRKIMGLESQGMMLFASKEDGSLTLMQPAEHVPNGSALR